MEHAGGVLTGRVWAWCLGYWAVVLVLAWQKVSCRWNAASVRVGTLVADAASKLCCCTRGLELNKGMKWVVDKL